MRWPEQIQLFFFIFGCFILYSNARKSYSGYKVLEVLPKSSEDVKYLLNLQLSDDNLRFGSRPSFIGRPVHIMVSPVRLKEMEKKLKIAGFTPSIHIEDIQSMMEPLLEGLDSTKKENGKRVFDIDNFNTFKDIEDWMKSLVSQCRSGIMCQLTTLGNSFENRPVYIFKITKNGSNRKAFYVDATTQSSDWISTSTAVHILNALATGSNSDAIRLADNYDWHIIPVVNPDGYTYTYENDRFWLKNRRPNGQCYGTNLNVNFDNRWGVEGVSLSPCNNEFAGTGPASEPETRLVQAELRRLAPTLRATLSLHSYGNMWTFSYGFTDQNAGTQCSYTVDHSNMLNIATAAADATQATYGTSWARGTVCDVITPVSGIGVDFVKESAGVHNAFALNLRGDGFVLDKSEIGPAFAEVWNGIVAMIRTIEGQ